MNDPGECNYKSCDQAALIRHRKNLHGYIPGSPAGRTDRRRPSLYELSVELRWIRWVLPMRLRLNFRGIFLRRHQPPHHPMSPPPYPSPSSSPPSWYSHSPSYSVSPSPPVASGSRQPAPHHYFRSHSYYLTTYSSGESEVSLSTPITSPPMISSSSILTESLTDPYYPTHSPSLPFTPTTQDY